MATMTEYSEAHVTAFKLWRYRGVHTLNDGQLEALREDPGFEREVDEERARRVYQLDEIASHPPRPAPSAQKSADGTPESGFVTVRHLHAAFKAYTTSICEPLREALELRDARIATLETELSMALARITGLDTKSLSESAFKDCGVWDTATHYERSNGVSFDGGFWLCQRAVRGEQPGNSTAWRLAVRRGKTGKEGPPGRDGKDLT
jgi:hypothetical protein